MDSDKHWIKNISLFIISQTISIFGSSLVQYAIMWFITLETKSGLMLMLSIICGFLPTFFISPFAGVWADRYNRKMLIILSDSLIALSTLILAILFFLGFKSIWLIFVIYAIRALGSGVQTPAIGAIIPKLVPEDKLTKVSGINGSIQAVVMLISPMIGGFLYTITSIEIIFLIDVITAFIAVLTFQLFLQVPIHEKALNKEKTSYFKDIQIGFSYIKNHAFLKIFFIYFAILFFLASPVAFLTPLQVTRSFGEEVWRLTAIEITFSIGMMLGGIVISSWGGFKNKIYTMSLSGIIIGICTFALGLIPIFWLYLLLMSVVGLAMPLFNTPSTVLLQEKVEENFLGRVFGVLGMISSVMMPLGMLLFGPLSDIIQIEWLLIITGIFMFILSIFFLGNKVLIEAGKPKIK